MHHEQDGEWLAAHNRVDVDDCKICHIVEKVVTDMLTKLGETFGKESSVTVTRGLVHDCVGMTIYYSVEGKVKFYMFDYIEQILSEIDSKLMSGASVVDASHRNVALLLFRSKRSRPDL